ncbi:helix-turn-helix transcriptional regulator [Polynucleobacter sp. UB-Piko-W3]|uniref:helix-turn-helix domain-containing protein n=1 Tax=Polynucleobacter sp. UB-Piko-W3 TaxID=1819735 RepID=UPI001C0AA20E|nr:helix-turn-helix transcriptional regulator [Polynucleobacter sp. UB-Piko-W3]MBU3554846.1 helix-turn-helix transcriptional regulator [Polynucleobacter sp. UB-Piko-W3]
MPKKNEPMMMFVGGTTNSKPLKVKKVSTRKDGSAHIETSRVTNADVPSNDSSNKALSSALGLSKQDALEEALKRIEELEKKMNADYISDAITNRTSKQIAATSKSLNLTLTPEVLEQVDAKIQMKRESTRASLHRLRQEKLAAMPEDARELYIKSQAAAARAREEALAKDPEAAERLKQFERERMEKRMNEERSRELSNATSWWFRKQLQERQLTQTKLAQELNMDTAAVSHMINGRRQVSLKDATRLAEVFNIPTTEVMRQVGYDVKDEVRMIGIRSYTSDGFNVKVLDHGGMPSKVAAPYDVGARAFAIQDRTSGSPRDGWLMFIGEQKIEPNLALHRLALITLQSPNPNEMVEGFSPVQVLGIAMPGYTQFQYKILKAPELTEYLEDVFISHIQPVLWIQPRGILHHFKP